jgi:hypothetical protein
MTQSTTAVKAAPAKKTAANQATIQPENPLDATLSALISFFSSLKLTVVCLAIGLILVFAGTLAQVDLGLYKAQNDFFRSFLVYWTPKGSSLRIPVFPGGYFIGGVLVINLVTAHFTRFKWTNKKIGIWMVHIGLIILVLGQFGTDMLSVESGMQLTEGESKNYSEEFRGNELVLLDKTDPKSDLVYSIPENLLIKKGEIQDARLPFSIKLKSHWINSRLVAPRDQVPPAAIQSGATAGILRNVALIPEAPVTDTDHRNTPSAVVEIFNGKESLGSFLVSGYTSMSQGFTAGGKSYEIALHPTRHYYPFSLTLLKATHEQYKGTDIPKNFASRVRVQNPESNEARETVIYMNNPLRYAGLTFFQYQMAAGEIAERAGVPPSSTFQVVRNPSWLTPYISCVMISSGLLVQFLTHLVGFVRRRTV